MEQVPEGSARRMMKISCAALLLALWLMVAGTSMRSSLEVSSSKTNTSFAQPHCNASDAVNETKAFDEGFDKGRRSAVDARSTHEKVLWISGAGVAALLNTLAFVATMSFDGTDLKDITSPASLSVAVLTMLAFPGLKIYLHQSEEMEVDGSVDLINSLLVAITLLSMMRCVLRSTAMTAVDKWLSSRIASILSVGLVSFPALMGAMMMITFAVQETWSWPSTVVLIIAFVVWLAFLALFHLVVRQGFKEVMKFKDSEEGRQIIDLQKEKEADEHLNRGLTRRNRMLEEEKVAADEEKARLAADMIEFKNACNELLKESLSAFPGVHINDPRVQEALKEVKACGKVEGLMEMLKVIKAAKANEDRSVPEDIIRSLLRAANHPRVRGDY